MQVYGGGVNHLVFETVTFLTYFYGYFFLLVCMVSSSFLHTVINPTEKLHFRPILMGLMTPKNLTFPKNL